MRRPLPSVVSLHCVSVCVLNSHTKVRVSTYRARHESSRCALRVLRGLSGGHVQPVPAPESSWVQAKLGVS